MSLWGSHGGWRQSDDKGMAAESLGASVMGAFGAGGFVRKTMLRRYRGCISGGGWRRVATTLIFLVWAVWIVQLCDRQKIGGTLAAVMVRWPKRLLERLRRDNRPTAGDIVQGYIGLVWAAVGV